MQPLSPSFFDKKAPPFKKTRFFQLSIFAFAFFCLFHIFIDFRVLSGAPLARNVPKKHQQMTFFLISGSISNPSRGLKGDKSIRKKCYRKRVDKNLHIEMIQK